MGWRVGEGLSQTYLRSGWGTLERREKPGNCQSHSHTHTCSQGYKWVLSESSDLGVGGQSAPHFELPTPLIPWPTYNDMLMVSKAATQAKQLLNNTLTIHMRLFGWNTNTKNCLWFIFSGKLAAIQNNTLPFVIKSNSFWMPVFYDEPCLSRCSGEVVCESMCCSHSPLAVCFLELTGLFHAKKSAVSLNW